MGNQNSVRQVPLESFGKGISLSAGTSPKKLSADTKDEVGKQTAIGNKVNLLSLFW